MEKIVFDHSKEHIHEVIGVPAERIKAIQDDLAAALFAMFDNPGDQKEVSSFLILEAFTQHAKSEKERLLLAFRAGKFVQASKGEVDKHKITHDVPY